MNGLPPLEHFLSNYQYERFQKLILERTGMLFGIKRRNALGRGVTRLCEKDAEGDLDRYFQMIETTETDSPLWDALIEALTVGETYFFRDENQIQALREHLLPQIIATHKHDRRIRLWSAGCASGEEPYTLSMLLAELIPDVDQWNISILATDINKKVLKKGKAARYRPWSFRQTAPLFQARYFTKKNEEYEVLPRIRKSVHFEYLNLSEPVYPSLFTNTNAMDMILCRNVAIYYSDEVVRRVVARFGRCLLPGGWLMMGAAETSMPVFDNFGYHIFSGGAVFRKLNDPVAAYESSQGEAVHEIPLSDPEPILSMPGATSSSEARDITPVVEDEVKTATEQPAVLEESTSAPDFRELGTDLIHQKRYEEAKDIFLRCIAENPRDAESLYQLGRIHANIGQMEAAQSFCEQAIEINPLNADVYYTLALIQQESGDREEAVERLKRTLFLDPEFALAHVTMAMLCRQLNWKEKSDRHLRSAIDLACAMAPETIVRGTDDLTARTLLTMAKTLK
jgi:chemotaxis protein methyltransferase CheR